MAIVKKYHKLLLILGIFYVLYWLFDFYQNALLPHNFSWILWYSSAGFLITGIALIIQNEPLIWSLFCALFAIEGSWTFDFIYGLIFHKSLLGFTGYIDFLNFDIKHYYSTFYHPLIPIGLLITMSCSRKIYKYSWLGATLFASILIFLTYLFVNPDNPVNCLFSSSECNTIFKFLYKIPDPYRTFIALLGLTSFVYIPTNYFLIRFKKK